MTALQCVATHDRYRPKKAWIQADGIWIWIEHTSLQANLFHEQDISSLKLSAGDTRTRQRAHDPLGHLAILHSQWKIRTVIDDTERTIKIGQSQDWRMTDTLFYFFIKIMLGARPSPFQILFRDGWIMADPSLRSSRCTYVRSWRGRSTCTSCIGSSKPASQLWLWPKQDLLARPAYQWSFRE